MPPDRRFKGLISLESELSFCAKFCPTCTDWASWPMQTIPPPCWKSVRFRKWPTSSKLRSSHSKSAKLMTSRPSSRRITAPRMPSMSRPTAYKHQQYSHQYVGSRRATADVARPSGGFGTDLLGESSPDQHPGAELLLSSRSRGGFAVHRSQSLSKAISGCEGPVGRMNDARVPESS
jgi:hypothetical protein